MPWSRKFEDPMPHGMVTLQDAANFMMKLSKAERESDHWKAAGEAVIMAAEDRGPILHARVGMLRALNLGKAKPNPGPRRKAAKSYRVIR